METNEGDYWVGLYQQGLDRFNLNTGVFAHYPPNPTDDHFPSDGLVFSLAYDAHGDLWVGTNNGLNHLTQGRFIRYYYDRDNRNSISSNTIRLMFRNS